MKTIIKTSLLLLLLCIALQQNASANPEALDAAKRICCYSESNMRIPLKRLESYHWTSSSCPLKHIVFVTVLNKQICVNPEDSWVQRAIEHIDNKRASDSTKLNS